MKFPLILLLFFCWASFSFSMVSNDKVAEFAVSVGENSFIPGQELKCGRKKAKTKVKEKKVGEVPADEEEIDKQKEVLANNTVAISPKFGSKVKSKGLTFSGSSRRAFGGSTRGGGRRNAFTTKKYMTYKSYRERREEQGKAKTSNRNSNDNSTEKKKGLLDSIGEMFAGDGENYFSDSNNKLFQGNGKGGNKKKSNINGDFGSLERCMKEVVNEKTNGLKTSSGNNCSAGVKQILCSGKGALSPCPVKQISGWEVADDAINNSQDSSENKWIDFGKAMGGGEFTTIDAPVGSLISHYGPEGSCREKSPGPPSSGKDHVTPDGCSAFDFHGHIHIKVGENSFASDFLDQRAEFPYLKTIAVKCSFLDEKARSALKENLCEGSPIDPCASGGGGESDPGAEPTN